MSLNLDRLTGESVYANPADYSHKVDAPLYVATRALTREYVGSGTVLDLGCSDGRVSHGLSDSFTVVGVDMATSALEAFSEYSLGSAPMVCADINSLPFRQESTQDSPNASLMIDVLEHVSWDEATTVLGGLQNVLAPDHTLVVSMPIISGLSLNTWAERWQVFKAGQRPEIGLYDRTHQILTNAMKHKQLFEAAGYEVEAEYRTLSDGSVVGINGASLPTNMVNNKIGEVVIDSDDKTTAESIHFSLAKVRRVILSPRNSGARVIRSLREDTMAHRALLRLLEFQGLYVLKPAKADSE